MATGDEGFGSSFSGDSETSGTITDITKGVSLTLLGGLVVGVLAAWLLVPLAGLERGIAVALGGVAGVVLAYAVLIVIWFARQALHGSRIKRAVQRDPEGFRRWARGDGPMP
jgi:predicted membrane-bound spermidine synthase